MREKVLRSEINCAKNPTWWRKDRGARNEVSGGLLCV